MKKVTEKYNNYYLCGYIHACLWPSFQNSSGNFHKWTTLEVGVTLSEFNVDIKN